MLSLCLINVFFLVQLMLGILSMSNVKEEHVFHRSYKLESENIPAQEISVLQDLYISTNGNEWIWRDASYGIPWNFTANCNPCVENWQGVTCKLDPNSSSQHIIMLSLNNYNLHGTLPTSLMNITKLEQLIMSNNNLYGKLQLIELYGATLHVTYICTIL